MYTKTQADDSTVSWVGRTSDGQPVKSKIGDTAHSGADAVYDRDATLEDPTRDYGDTNGLGSHFREKDVPDGKAEKFERLYYWQESATPSYEDPDGDESGGSVVQPSDDTGRRSLQDKLATVERVCNKLDTPPAVRAEARTLASSADGTGHSLEKVALGAVLVAQDRFLANRLVGADVDGPLQEAITRLSGDVGDHEIDTILNLLEGEESLAGVFRRRLKRREDVVELADRHDFKLNNAKAVFYSDD